MLEKPAASGARQVSRTDSQLVAERRLLASAGATPLPPRPTLKSGPASFATTSVANLPPSLRGANRTFTVQVAPATFSTALPVLVSVTALVCGTFRGVAKLTEASTEACGTVPLPVRLTAVVGALLEMDSTPVLAPTLAGEKVTVMSQPPAGGT